MKTLHLPSRKQFTSCPKSGGCAWSTQGVLHALAFAIGIASAGAASAQAGRGILNNLPDLTQQGPTEAQCKALDAASLAYKAQAKAVGDPLAAQLNKGAEDLQKKVAAGKMPRDEMLQSMVAATITQEMAAADPERRCGFGIWPDLALKDRFLADSNAASGALGKAIDACPLINNGGEFGAFSEPGCVKAAKGRHLEAQLKLNQAYLKKAREGYIARQKQLQQCVITASDIRANHLTEAKGPWKAAVDPTNETVHAATLAEYLTASAASICFTAFERLPKP